MRLTVGRKVLGAGIVAIILAGCGGGGAGEMEATGYDPSTRFANAGPGRDGRPKDPNRPITFRILEPMEDQTLHTNEVRVAFKIENYELDQDPATKAGNHIHFILDNEPYIPHYDEAPFTFRDVPEGTHVIRAFPSRPWHESWKNPEAFGCVTFHVGKASATNPLDMRKPMLTYSRPKGSYEGADTERVLLDFWVSNCQLSAGGYHVRYTVDGGDPTTLYEWRPVWLAGLGKGKHSVRLELLDGSGNPVGNGWNRTEREIVFK